MPLIDTRYRLCLGIITLASLFLISFLISYKSLKVNQTNAKLKVHAINLLMAFIAFFSSLFLIYTFGLSQIMLPFSPVRC